MSLSTGSIHRRPESNSSPGPAHSMAGIVKNSMSTGAFQYEALTSSNNSTSSAGVNSSKSRLDDDAVQCSCGPFWGLRAKQLGGRNRSSKNSGLSGGNHETDEMSFLFRLLASYGKLRESIKETSVNIGDLFGSQILFLMTASPIIPRAPKSVSSGSTRRRLAIVPATSISKSSSSLVEKSNGVGIESSKTLSRTRDGDFNADRRPHSFRR